MHAVFLDTDGFDDIDLSELKATVSSFDLYDGTSPALVHERCQAADIIVTNKVVLTAESLEALPQLKLICVVATGTNNVDLEAAKVQGVAVANCVAYGVQSVAQHALGLMLALSTRLVDYNAAVKQGEWSKAPTFCLLDYPIAELSGKTLGIVGYGHLGRAVARLAEAFGMKVIVAARPASEEVPADRVAFEVLVKSADVISLHCPLTPITANLFDAEVLAAMKPGALLVNCARGGIVDEQALANALKSHHLGGAATDVLSQEPPVNGNPLFDTDIPNLIITPHCAWGSFEARKTIIHQTRENICGFLSQESTRRVV